MKFKLRATSNVKAFYLAKYSTDELGQEIDSNISFKMVFKWRLLQENKLRKRSHFNKRIMSYNEIKRFIMFYQRITLQMIKDLSKSASIVMLLKKNHEIKKILFR